MSHAKLHKAAKTAIQEVFGDDSVPKTKTRESLEDLRADIDTYLESLREDDTDDGEE